MLGRGRIDVEPLLLKTDEGKCIHGGGEGSQQCLIQSTRAWVLQSIPQCVGGIKIEIGYPGATRIECEA